MGTKTFDELRGWFIDHLHDRWDRQIEADSAAGKLDFLIDDASEAERRGETRSPRQPGGWDGRMRISEDFDAPLPPEIQDAFEGLG